MEDKIIIKKNPNGDTRTAKGDITFEDFQKANDMHINDVNRIMSKIGDCIKDIGAIHDWTKKQYEREFFDDFNATRNEGADFVNLPWYQKHIREERHHINNYVHGDVDLLDVLEMIADCVGAGLARSGEMRPIEMDKEVLYKAFENTCELVKNMCVLEE